MEEVNNVLMPISRDIIYNEHSFYFDTEVGDPSYYRVFIDTLINASDGDSVKIFINSPGGNKDSMIAIIAAIEATSAEVTGILLGDASSAASAILISCHNWHVGRGSSMMIHEVSTGYGSNATDFATYGKFVKSQSDELIYRVYSGFLTDEEINRVCNGEPIYFNDSEIFERLELLSKYRNINQESVKVEEKIH